MRTTLELPYPLFARPKARAISERLTLKQLLRSYVEQGLNTLTRVEGRLAIRVFGCRYQKKPDG